jgi:hypothetical protein
VFAKSQTVSGPLPAERPGFANILQIGQRSGNLQDDVELYDALNVMRAEDFREAVCLWTTEMQAKFGYMELQTRAILDRWFKVDPASARQFAEAALKSASEDGGESEYPRTLFRQVLSASAARHDPRWAIEHLLFPSSKTYELTNSNTTLMEEVVKRDRSLAKDWMARMENNVLRPAVVLGYVKGLAEIDPIAALDAAMAEKTFMRLSLIPIAVQVAARQGSNGAKLALERIDDPDKRRDAAFDSLEVLINETQADPFQFISDTIGLDHLDEVRERLQFDLGELVETNPAAAANWAMQLPQEKRAEFLNGVVNIWGDRDPEAMLAWMSEKQGTNSPSMAETGQLFAIKQLLDRGKLDEAVASLPRMTQPSDLIIPIADRLGRENPEAASQWISGLPESEAKKEAARGVVERWTEIDPLAASTWVEQLPAGTTRDTALRSMILVLAQRDPETAGKQVELYSDLKERRRGVADVFDYWHKSDPSAAREWVKAVSGVDEHWKTNFLRRHE